MRLKIVIVEPSIIISIPTTRRRAPPGKLINSAGEAASFRASAVPAPAFRTPSTTTLSGNGSEAEMMNRTQTKIPILRPTKTIT